MDMHKQLSILALALFAGPFLLLGSAVMAGPNPGEGIVGSAHGGGPAAARKCVLCHTPHNSIAGEQPLWNHTLSITDHTGALYSSDTLNASPGLPDGTSKLCLSCHDGSVAVDDFGGRTGPFGYYLGGNKAIGSDGLTNDHPISFVYEQSRSNGDEGLRDSLDPGYSVTVGATKSKSGTLAAMLLDASGKLQCNSCHDVHNNYTVGGGVSGNKLLRITMAGSALCLTCHTK